MSKGTLPLISLVVFLIVGSLLLSCAPAAPTATPTVAPTPTAGQGAALYDSYRCANCHGAEGEGVTGAGPTLAGAGLDQATIEEEVRTAGAHRGAYTEEALPEADVGQIVQVVLAMQ